jgi:hemerythrin
MALISWNSNYSIGNDGIDSQHQKLVQLINTLHEEMKMGKAKEILLKVLDELANYTVMHFSNEEKLFGLHKYPGILKHKKQHEDFVAKVIAFKESYINGNARISLELMSFLKDWLISHISKSDKEYAAYFVSKGVF